MSSPPREQNKNYWLAADINALNGLTGALSEAVCEPGVLQGRLGVNQVYYKVGWGEPGVGWV